MKIVLIIISAAILNGCLAPDPGIYRYFYSCAYNGYTPETREHYACMYETALNYDIGMGAAGVTQAVRPGVGTRSVIVVD